MLHLNCFLDEIPEKKPDYTNFGREKLFLQKSSTILLIMNQKWVELISKVSISQGD